MEIKEHPYLEGIKCREDGAVWIPPAHAHPGHWTLGHALPSGYRQVTVSRKPYSVHRLICEAFHGICPEDKKVVDHINRVRGDNRPENLRWVTLSENNRNCSRTEESLRKFGCSQVDDKNAYNKAYQKHQRKTNPAWQARERERHKEYRARKRAEIAV